MKQIQDKLEKTIEHQEMEINSCKQQMTDLELKYKDKMEELMAQNRALMRQQTEQSDDFENYDETVTTVVAANCEDMKILRDQIDSLSIKENDLEDGYKQDEDKIQDKKDNIPEIECQVRKVMLKKSDDKSCRAHYLRKIKKFRSEGRNIIFLDETWIFLGHGQRLIIVHAGSRKGFVTGALLFFISKKTGDDRQDMDGKAFEKWFEETLLPLLEENSVVVMDNAPYHSVQADNVPQRNWSKGEMQKWLRQNSVHFDIQMIKSKLWSLIKDIKSRFQKFKVDEIALKAGHEVLRLPPRHCILNPIEMAWSQVKDFVTKKNETIKLNHVQDLFKVAIKNVTKQNWENYDDHVIKVENLMWNMDGLLE